ncbi:MAG: ABC transporter permease [Lachnospiraceae bacterium]|nr:ABC transporter permease [Lachnospiraceae bacterium]
MKSYRSLAFRYLKLNIKRTVLTILGIGLLVMVLFAAVNLFENYFLDTRRDVREMAGYDVMVYADSMEKAEAIAKDKDVQLYRIFTLGGEDTTEIQEYNGNIYYIIFLKEDKEVSVNGEAGDIVMTITVKRPYHMDEIAKRISEEYGVRAKYDEDVAALYLIPYANEDEGTFYLMLAVVLGTMVLAMYVYAVFSVGIVSNSISLSITEQIRDYGNLRCIGATRKEIKHIVFWQAFIIEELGILLGIVLGQILSVVLGPELGVSSAFHLLPIIPIEVCYLFDLIFIVREGSKAAYKMSPVEAIRGNFRTVNERIKPRRSRILRMIFGFEGEYAYKNCRRKKGRFWKPVLALSVGIGGVIMMAALLSYTLNEIYARMDENGSFPVATTMYVDEWLLTEEKKAASKYIYSEEKAESIAKELKGEYTKVWETYIYITEPEKGFMNSYRSRITDGLDVNEVYELNKEGCSNALKYMMLCRNYVYSFDEATLKKLKNDLIEGTIDVSDKGIIMILGGEYTTEEGEKEGYRTSTAGLGDEITFVDPTIYAERQKQNFEKYKKELGLSSEKGVENTEEEVINEFALKYYCQWLSMKELEAEGKTHTYVIEGIVKKGITGMGLGYILPNDSYYSLTGVGEDDYNGYAYSLPKILYYRQDTLEGIMEKLNYEYQPSSTSEGVFYNSDTMYLETLISMLTIRNIIAGIAAVLVIVFSVNCMNIINTAASSIYTRRHEFAQLRAVGVSVRQLRKMVFLEGVIVFGLACVIGMVAGTGMFMVVKHYLIDEMYNATFTFPWVISLVMLLASFIVLIGAYYVPMLHMRRDLAGELNQISE